MIGTFFLVLLLGHVRADEFMESTSLVSESQSEDPCCGPAQTRSPSPVPPRLSLSRDEVDPADDLIDILSELEPNDVDEPLDDDHDIETISDTESESEMYYSADGLSASALALERETLLDEIFEISDNLHENTELDTDLVPIIDQIRAMTIQDLTRLHSDSVTDETTNIIIQEWLQSAVRLSRRPEQDIRRLSVILVKYAIRGVVCDPSGPIQTDLVDIFNLLLDHSYPDEFPSELITIAELLTPDLLSVRNSLGDTPLMAAFRVIPAHGRTLAELIHKSLEVDVAAAMQSVLAQVGVWPWARMFHLPIQSRLRRLNYKIDLFLDEMQVQEPEDRVKVEFSIRMQDLFYAKWFLISFCVMFIPTPGFVTEEQLPKLLADMDGLGEDRRQFLLDSMAMIRAKTITAIDILERSRFPDDCPILMIVLAQHINAISRPASGDGNDNITTAGSRSSTSSNRDDGNGGRQGTLLPLPEFLDMAIKNADLRIGLFIDRNTAHISIPLILHRILPNLNIDAADVYDRILERAMSCDPSWLQINLLRIALYLIRIHYYKPELMKIWTSTFTRTDVLDMVPIRLDLIQTLGQVLPLPIRHHVKDSAARVVAALISHYDLRDDMIRYEQIPSTAMQMLCGDLIRRLPTDVLVRVYMSIEDDPRLNIIFHRSRSDLDSTIPEQLSYFVDNYSDWMRTQFLQPASDQEIVGLDDICSICLSGHGDNHDDDDDNGDHHVTYRTVCGHYFHLNCAMNCFRTSAHCPNCRSVLFNHTDIVSHARRHPLTG